MEGFDIFPLKCLYTSVKLEPIAKKYKIPIKTLSGNFDLNQKLFVLIEYRFLQIVDLH